MKNNTKALLKTILALELPKKIECSLARISHLILRVSLATLIMTHGVPKFLNFSKILEANSYPDPLGIGIHLSLSFTVLTEFFAAVFLLLGLFTRWASFALFVTFLIIIFIVHAEDSFKDVELAVMYLLGFTYFMLAGSTKEWSLDNLLSKKL